MSTAKSPGTPKTESASKTSGSSKNASSSAFGESEFASQSLGADLSRRLDDPQSLPKDDILHLQRMVGNQAVANLLARKTSSDAPSDAPAIGTEGGPVTSDIEKGISRARGGGRSLGKGVKSQMESGFGADFSSVRVHTGPEADSLNQSMQARAFTTGKDIFFKKDAYNPHSGDGRKLLAHELTHVVQQGGAGKAQRKPKLQRKPRLQRQLKVGPATDRYEEEADRVASSVMRAQRTPQHTVQRSPKSANGELIQRNLKDKLSNAGKNIKTSSSNTKNKIVTSPTYQTVTTKLNQFGAMLGRGGERVGSELSNKSTKVVGKEKKKSEWSREEAAKTLDMPINERVAALQEVFQKEKDPTSAFKRVAFLLEGRVIGSIEAAYDNATPKPPKTLRQTIIDTFTNRPHKYSGDYLLNILDNDGRAELKARIWLTLGLVDSPAVDETRLVELAERANFAKFKVVWQSMKDEVQKRAGIKTFNRLEAYVDAKEKGEQVESTRQSGGTVAPTDREALSAARDKHLATIVTFRRHELGKKAKMGLKALKLLTMIPLLAAAKPVPMMINAISTTVDTQELSDDILKWRKLADQEDVDYIKTKGTASEFDKALAALPKVAAMRLSNLRGVTEAEVEYFKNLAIADIGPGGDDVAKESKLKSTAVFNAIKREQAANGQGKFGKGRAKVTKKVRAKMGAGKWDELAPQILEMTKEQRAEFLNQYPGATPTDKLTALKVELDKAGIGEDKVGPIVALFENQHAEAGPGYLALVDYVTQQTKMKSKFGKFKRAVGSPTKKGKADKFAKKVIKLTSELRGNEFAQVRQSKTLLQDIEANSGDKWFTIMRMLGVTSSTDQLTGTTEENISDAQKKAEQSPEYWATQIEAIAAKSAFRGGSFNYAPPTTPSVGKNGKTQTPQSPKAVKIKKLKFEEVSWIIIRAQSVAHQIEDETSGNPTAAQFMLQIFNALQPETQAKIKADATTTSTKEDDIKKADKLGKIHLALTDQAKHPLNAKDAVKKSLKKAETKWYKTLWRPRPDRVRIVNSFSRLEGKELLDEWSNFEQYEHLYEGSEQADKLIQDLNNKIVDKRKEISNETDTEKLKVLDKELTLLTRRRDNTTEHRMLVQGEMKSFVLGIRSDRYKYLLKMRALTSDDRLKIIAMLTEKIIAASEGDPEVQVKMLMMDMSFDEWMKAKMRGIDAIEMQRHLDTTRQWHLFSNKSSQLDEGTRRVVGTIRSGNEEMREAEKTNKSEDELQALKSKYSNRAQGEITDRKQVEAAFRDMQAKFNARASLIIRIITTILITAISVGISAASMGIATPIMIAINAGLLLSQVAIHAAFDYFVLKKPITQVALEAGVAIMQMALTLLTMNLGTAMNASFLHPDLFLKGTEWIAPNLSKALSKTILGIAMAYPKTVMKMAYEQQPLEEAVAKGKEKAMGKALGKAFLMGAAKPWLKFMLKGGIGGVMYGMEQAKTPIYEGIYGSPPPTTESGGTSGGTVTNQVTTPMPTGQQFLSDPGGSLNQTVASGQDSVETGIKGALTPVPTESPPQRGLLETFVDPQTTKDNLDTMIKKQKKKIKKEAKKDAVGKGSKGGWLSSTTNTEQSRKEGMEGNRERIVKGMRLVAGTGTSTRLSTSVTTLTTDVRIVYFGGGWRLEDTGTPKTATLNGKPLARAMPLTPGDRVAVGSTQYSVELGSG